MSRTRSTAARATPRTQRTINSLAVLDAVRTGPQSVASLCVRTGLSRTAAESVVSSLIELGWLSADAVAGHAGAGRPARLIAMNATVGTVLGVDIGVHKIQICLADLSGRVVERQTSAVAPEAGVEERLARCVELCRSVVLAAGRRLEDVWLIAVGTPGVVEDGRVTHFVGIPGWEGLDLAAKVQDGLGRPTVVENDCNLAAIAERSFGKAAGVDELVYILSGNRTGAGLILAGELYRGWRGGAGEIGALRALGWSSAQELLADVVVDGTRLDRTAVFEAAAHGRVEAVEAVDRFSAALAQGIAALVLALDPELVVIGGGVSRAGSALLRPLRAHVAALSVVREPTIVLSDLGDESVSLGAVRRALDLIERHLVETAYETERFPAPHPSLLESMSIA